MSKKLVAKLKDSVIKQMETFNTTIDNLVKEPDQFWMKQKKKNKIHIQTENLKLAFSI
jgi:hypothetical protein